MSKDQIVNLDYSRHAPRRRLRFLASVAIGIGVVVMLCWGWTSAPGKWAQRRFWQYRCEHHSPTEQLPAYSTDPDLVPTMLAAGSEYVSARSDRSDALYIPREWRRLHELGTPGAHFGDGVVFLHERNRARPADARLVIVHLDGSSSEKAFEDATSTGPAILGGQKVAIIVLRAESFKLSNVPYIVPVALSATVMILPWAERFSLYDGKPDPIDGSRFRMAYRLAEQQGAIEGRLENDDSVILQVIEGPLVLFEWDPKHSHMIGQCIGVRP
jgi:hypothetical protein